MADIKVNIKIDRAVLAEMERRLDEFAKNMTAVGIAANKAGRDVVIRLPVLAGAAINTAGLSRWQQAIIAAAKDEINKEAK